MAWERGYHLDSPHTTMQQSEDDANPIYPTKSNTGPWQSYQLVTFLSAKEAVCPPRTSLTGSLFLWMPLMETEKNSPREVGPSRRTSLTLITPCIHVPDTTVPTPWDQRERHRIQDNKDTVVTRNLTKMAFEFLHACVHVTLDNMTFTITRSNNFQN